MLTKLNSIREEREEGFTLIELLVVILIIGILAAIAIPVFLNQRKTANDGAVESDVKNAASQIESWIVGQKGLNTDVPLTALTDVKVSEGVTLTVYGSANDYCVKGEHENGKNYVTDAPLNYSSYNGGLGKTCSVAATPAGAHVITTSGATTATPPAPTASTAGSGTLTGTVWAASGMDMVDSGYTWSLNYTVSTSNTLTYTFTTNAPAEGGSGTVTVTDGSSQVYVDFSAISGGSASGTMSTGVINGSNITFDTMGMNNLSAGSSFYELR